MGKIGFTEERRHYSAEKGLNELIYGASGEDYITGFCEQNDFARPNSSYAYDLQIGKELKRFVGFTKTSLERSMKMIENHYGKTNIVDYINAGQNGYYSVSAKITSNRKKGKKFRVAFLKEGYPQGKYKKVENIFFDRKLAEKVAIRYQLLNLEREMCILNEKDVEVAFVQVDKKYYKRKPNLVKKDWRKIVPAYEFVYKGSCYVG